MLAGRVNTPNLFVAMATKEEKDISGPKGLDWLRTPIEDSYQAEPLGERQTIFCPCKQLHYRRQLHNLRDKLGVIICDP